MSPENSMLEAPIGARRRPRKIVRETSSAARSESGGGVPIPREGTERTQETALAPQRAEHTPSRRRRPKKLNSNSDNASATARTSGNASGSAEVETTVKPEIEALRNRVEGIESQLHELLKRTPPKLPRRRQRPRKAEEPEAVDDGQQELAHLEGELTSARKELDRLRVWDSSKADSSPAIPGDEEGVEEIVRPSPPAADPAPATRAVVLSGSYRLPIPFSATESELQAIQTGISSAQRLARRFLAANPLYDSVSTERAYVSKNTVTRSGETWSEWYGGYNVSVSRPARTITASATPTDAPFSSQEDTSQPLPLRSNLRRAVTGTPGRRAPPKLEIRSGNKGVVRNTRSSVRRTASVPASSLPEGQIASLMT